MKPITLHRTIGLAGVSSLERPLARKVGSIFEFLAMGVVIWLTYQWHLEGSHQMGELASKTANLTIWFYFITQLCVMLIVVKDRKRYLRHNWLQVLFIAIGAELVFTFIHMSEVINTLRLALVLCLLIPWLDRCRRSLSDNRLGTTIGAAALVTILSGILITGIDPSIQSAGDGIWWAWVTVTTLGYGDVVPTSTVGRIFGAALILMGLGLFATLMANFTSLFWAKDVKEVREESANIRRILERISKLRSEEGKILRDVDHVKRRENNILLNLNRVKKDEAVLQKSVDKLKKEEDDMLMMLKDIQARLTRIEKQTKDNK